MVQTPGFATLFAQLAIYFAQLLFGQPKTSSFTSSAVFLTMFGGFGSSSAMGAAPSPAMGLQLDTQDDARVLADARA